MKRLTELENILRDKQLIKVELQLEYFSTTDNNSIDQLNLHILKNDKSKIILVLSKIKRLELNLESFSSHYIEVIKCLQNEKSIIISLDPFDERIEEIENKDNFIIEFLEYKVIKI